MQSAHITLKNCTNCFQNCTFGIKLHANKTVPSMELVSTEVSFFLYMLSGLGALVRGHTSVKGKKFLKNPRGISFGKFFCQKSLNIAI